MLLRSGLSETHDKRCSPPPLISTRSEQVGRAFIAKPAGCPGGQEGHGHPGFYQHSRPGSKVGSPFLEAFKDPGDVALRDTAQLQATALLPPGKPTSGDRRRSGSTEAGRGALRRRPPAGREHDRCCGCGAAKFGTAATGRQRPLPPLLLAPLSLCFFGLLDGRGRTPMGSAAALTARRPHPPALRGRHSAAWSQVGPNARRSDLTTGPFQGPDDPPRSMRLPAAHTAAGSSDTGGWAPSSKPG